MTKLRSETDVMQDFQEFDAVMTVHEIIVDDKVIAPGTVGTIVEMIGEVRVAFSDGVVGLVAVNDLVKVQER